MRLNKVTLGQVENLAGFHVGAGCFEQLGSKLRVLCGDVDNVKKKRQGHSYHSNTRQRAGGYFVVGNAGKIFTNCTIKIA